MVSHLHSVLIPLSKFKVIEEQLSLSSDRPEWQQPTDHSQGGEKVFGLLGNLQEAIFNYQVCLQHDTLFIINNDNR